MNDKQRLEKLLEKLNIPEKLDEVLNKHNINGPTTKFDNNDRLIWLDLSNLGISELPEDAFEGFDELQELKLFKNNLSTLPANIFNHTQNITELHLKDNQFKEVPKGVLEALPMLNRLFLLGNPLPGDQAKVYPNKPAVEFLLNSL